MADRIETPVLTTVDTMISALIAYASTPIKLALVIYIALTGILVMRGLVAGSFSDLLGRMIKLCLVAWIATTAGAYDTYVRDLFYTTLPNDITQTITGATGDGSIGADSFDGVWTKAFGAGLTVWKNLNWYDLGLELVVVAFWFVAMIAIVFGYLVWLLSHMMLGLLVAIGPLLVGLVLFPATRAIFERWIGSMLTCVILQALMVTLMTVLIAAESRLINQIVSYTGSNSVAQVQMLLAACILFIVCAVLATQLPGAASALSGGLHFHVGALARMTFGAGTGRSLATVAWADRRAVQAAQDLPVRLARPPGGSLSNASARSSASPASP